MGSAGRFAAAFILGLGGEIMMMVTIKRKNHGVTGYPCSSDKHFGTGNVCKVWNKLSLLFGIQLFFFKQLLKKSLVGRL